MGALLLSRAGSYNGWQIMSKTPRKRGSPRPVPRRHRAQEFNVVVERDEDGWLVGSVPELRGCHTQAKTMETLMQRIREAISLCLETEGDKPRSEFVAIARVTVDV
jgi:predicted RNase H-like HicB family nuclease